MQAPSSVEILGRARYCALDVVLKRQIRDSISIGFTQGLELSKGSLPILACACQAFVEGTAILKLAIHALAVEGHDGVRRIIHDQSSVLEMPGRRANGAEPAGGMTEELLFDPRHQRQGIGKLLVEKGRDLCLGREHRKALFAFVR